MRTFSNILAAAGLLALGGCVDAYLPEVVNANANYLVVDGFINGNGRTRIRLSRSENIATTTAPPAEKGASLVIVDDAGQRYPLLETSTSGNYLSDSLLLSSGRTYQLRITTAAKVIYTSPLQTINFTPPLDQLAWQPDGDQLNISLSTHDPTSQAQYYRWKYAETWEFNALYPSNLEFRGGIIQSRITPIFTCWHTEQPSIIQQASTAGLSQAVVANKVLLSPSTHSERFKIRYSVLVVQYAESAEEFAYNEVLRKNTEAVGTVNDPLPSQLTGNVHRLDNPQEPVLGFVGAHTVQSKRIFISRQDLPTRTPDYFENPYATCQAPDTAEIVKPYNKNGVLYPQSRVFADPANVPTEYAYGPTYGFPVQGYIGGARECIDCRVRGSNQKPAYW